jgi:hypothetical protein
MAKKARTYTYEERMGYGPKVEPKPPAHRFILGRASHDYPAPAMLTTRNPPFTITEAKEAQASERRFNIETTIYELVPVKTKGAKRGKAKQDGGGEDRAGIHRPDGA